MYDYRHDADMSNESKSKGIALLSFLGGSLAFVFFSWPLFSHFSTAIPFSSQNQERGSVVSMAEGDHLQLLYHFDLFHEFLSGELPWFDNRYEFNDGLPETTTVRVRSYFVPFSLVYGLLRFVSSQATAWNITCWLSIVLTFWMSWLLGRRFFPDSPWKALLIAIPGVLFPYRWVSLLGGSPAGFAMTWVPGFLLGLDYLYREGKTRHGILAGACFLFIALGDMQVFYFSLLFGPIWLGLVALRERADSAFDPDRNSLFSQLKTQWDSHKKAWGIGLSFAIVSVGWTLFTRKSLGDTNLSSSRPMLEIALGSADWVNLFRWEQTDGRAHQFFGFTSFFVLIAGWIGGFRVKDKAMKGLVLFCCLAVTICLLLALGSEGPLLKPARGLIPWYDRLRQPAKIYTVLPVLLTCLCGLCLMLSTSWSRWPKRALITCMLLMPIEYAIQVRTSLCQLETENTAYAAVKAENPERVLVIPFRKGDAATASIYEHFAMRYRLPLVNGYSPAVRKEWSENTFARFKSANQGVLDASQLDDLLARGVKHVIVHEDLFIGDITPLSSGLSIDRLRHHDRLTRIAGEGAITAYRILPGSLNQPLAPNGAVLPGQIIEWEDANTTNGPVRIIRAPDASKGIYLLKSYTNSFGESVAVDLQPLTDAGWTVRLRGNGVIGMAAGHRANQSNTILEFDHEGAWKWYNFPIPETALPGTVQLRATLLEGYVDLDSSYIHSGYPGEVDGFALLAADFRHRGMVDRDKGTVQFEPGKTLTGGPVLIGPQLPLPYGLYNLEFDYESDAPVGTKLFDIYYGTETRLKKKFRIDVGMKAEQHIFVDDNRPFRIEIRYRGRARVSIGEIRFERVPDPE